MVKFIPMTDPVNTPECIRHETGKTEMYYSAIGLLAVLILLIMNYDVLLQRREAFDKPAWRAYRRFLLSVLVYYVTDILWGLLESRKLAGALFADTTVYFIAMAAGVLFWTQYTVVYLDEKNAFGRLLLTAGRIIPGAITLLSLVNIFWPVLFTVDNSCVYRALPTRYVILGVQILLLLLVSAYAASLMKQKDARQRHRYLTLALFGLIMAAFLLIQLWFPYLPLYTIAYLLGTCLLHTFLVNGEREESRRDLQEASRIAELKESIASLLDNMPCMTFTKEAETGIYLACNQAFADYAHKAAPEGVVGLTDAEIFDAKTAAHFVEDDKMALSMEMPFIFFEDVPDAAGNPRQIKTTKRKYIDTAGRLCVLGMCVDMTDTVRIRRDSAMTREAYEKARSSGIIFTHIAQALARGYKELYYINLDTEEYIEYRADDDSGTLSETRRGWHFFEQCQIEAEQLVYADDRETVKRALDRKTLVAALDRDDTFILTYRLIGVPDPTYVSMRVTRMQDDERYIILGVTDIDGEMRQRRAAERMQEEQIAYTRINALTGDYLCIYVVDPESGRYREFSASDGYERFGLAKEGADFFADAREQGGSFVFPEDVNRFLTAFTKENILAEIENSGIFTLSYRLMMDGEPRYVQLKAAMVEEKEGPRLVVGINDIDAQVRQEETYVRNLAQARIEASVDALTGVKNRHAFLMAEERINNQIAAQRRLEFAVVVLDVNDLKRVNDTTGHEAGDKYLRAACKIICETFQHSPVFRIGGDEFAVISQGNDYAAIDELIARMRAHNLEAIETGGVTIACGMAKHAGEASMAPVFERADQSMYEDKSWLKAEKETKTGTRMAGIYEH